MIRHGRNGLPEWALTLQERLVRISEEPEQRPERELARLAEVAAVRLGIAQAHEDVQAFCRRHDLPLAGDEWDDLTAVAPLRRLVLQIFRDELLGAQDRAELARVAALWARERSWTAGEAAEALLCARLPQRAPTVQAPQRCLTDQHLRQFVAGAEAMLKSRRPDWAGALASLGPADRPRRSKRLAENCNRTLESLLAPSLPRDFKDRAEHEAALRARVADKFALGPLHRLGLGLPARQVRAQ